MKVQRCCDVVILNFSYKTSPQGPSKITHLYPKQSAQTKKIIWLHTEKSLVHVGNIHLRRHHCQCRHGNCDFVAPGWSNRSEIRTGALDQGAMPQARLRSIQSQRNVYWCGRTFNPTQCSKELGQNNSTLLEDLPCRKLSLAKLQSSKGVAKFVQSRQKPGKRAQLYSWHHFEFTVCLKIWDLCRICIEHKAYVATPTDHFRTIGVRIRPVTIRLEVYDTHGPSEQL